MTRHETLSELSDVQAQIARLQIRELFLRTRLRHAHAEAAEDAPRLADRAGRSDLGPQQFHLGAVPNRGVKAASTVRVTGGAFLRDQRQQAVAVAVDPQIGQGLHMAGRLALHPQRAA